MTAKHTPMSQDGTIIYFKGGVGIDLRACPDPEQLAAAIVRACNAHDDLVLNLALMISYMPAPEFDVDSARAHSVRAARATLAAAGAV